MSKTNFFKILLVSFVLLLASVNTSAVTYTYSFTASVWSAYGNQTLSSVIWTAAATGGSYFGYDAIKGQQFGSAASPANALSLTTSGITGTISSVKVNTSGASSVAGTVSVSVGGTAFNSGTIALTSIATDYTFTGSASGSIVVSWAQTSSKALYVKSIEITYASITLPPVVSVGSPTGNVAAPFSYSISATNSPSSYALASGTLPVGLTLNTATGVITGTPATFGALSVTVTATNSIGTSAPATLNFNIAKGNQAIIFGALDARTNADAPFNLTATTTSGLPVLYQSSNTSVATILGSTVTVVGIGTSTITASQSGSTNYNAATSVDQLLTVIQYIAPTMAITEIFNPQFTSVVGNSYTQTIDISGLNLTSAINLALSGTNSNQFSLAQNSISQSGGIAPLTFISLSYTPTSAGTHSATLTMTSDGAMSQSYSITGNSTITTDVNVPHISLMIYVENDKLRFTAQAGDSVEIYNAIGQKIIHKLAVDGKNSITVSARGVLVVKVGNRVAKVIL